MHSISGLILPAGLPECYAARPVTLDDAPAAAGLVNAHNIALTGGPAVEAGDIRSDWGQPGMNLAANTLAVFAQDDAMAGLAVLWDPAPHVRLFADAVVVHPEHQGRGIGSALAGWAEERGRQIAVDAPEGARVVLRQFKMSRDQAAVRLLTGRGYVLARHNLRMTIDFDRPPPGPAVPSGLIIRPFIRHVEERAILEASDEAFRDHWGHVERPIQEQLDEWEHWLDTAETCDPSLYFVAVDGAEIAGTALCDETWLEEPAKGWISGLAVRRPWRRRGLGQALLQRCFCALYARGKKGASLGVDAGSLTGATRLYEKAGMRVDEVYHFYDKELRPGRDLTIQALEPAGEGA